MNAPKRSLAGAFLLLLACQLAMAQDEPVASPSLTFEPSASTSPPSFRALVEGRRWEDLSNLVRKLLDQRPDDAELYYWLGVAESQLNLVKAVQAFRAAEKRQLQSAGLHRALGLVYFSLGQHPLFLDQMEKALALEPNGSETFHMLGRYYESIRNDFATALEHFQKALSHQPDHMASVYFRAYCLQMLRDLPAAKTGYEQAAELVEMQNKPFGWPYQKLAGMLLQQNPQAALGYVRLAVEREPGEVQHHLMLARVQESMGDLEAAVAERRMAAELDPTDASNYYVLFRLYRRLGKNTEAEQALRTHNKLRSVYAAKE